MIHEEHIVAARAKTAHRRAPYAGRSTGNDHSRHIASLNPYVFVVRWPSA
jgi:hypothetical protein